jgi:hypothetical protein
MFLFVGLVAIAVIILLVILFYRKSKANSSNNKVVSTNTAVSGLPNKKKTEDKKLTVQERLELSWQFLYEITEIIINKFSKEDIEAVNRIGATLLESGMRYEHVVDLGIKLAPSKGALEEIEQAKSGQSEAGVVR